MTDFSFLGMQFSPVRMSDCEVLSDFLTRYPQPLSGYTFASLATWNSFYQYTWKLVESETLLISCILEPENYRHLLQPVGRMSADVKASIVSQAVNLPYPLKMLGVCSQWIKDNSDFLPAFSAIEDRAVSNYIYSASSLASLPGRKYSKKRNLISQASALYSWSCHALSAPIVSDCFDVLNSIFKEESPVVEGMLKRELASLEYTLNHLAELKQDGMVIRVNGRPVAFSIFEPISPTTVAIHFERALRSYKGLYQVINWETSRVISNLGFQFINREEDLGNEGLRDAKTSYHPIEIAPAYELSYRNLPLPPN
jgi:hypothetical protein